MRLMMRNMMLLFRLEEREEESEKGEEIRVNSKVFRR